MDFQPFPWHLNLRKVNLAGGVRSCSENPSLLHGFFSALASCNVYEFEKLSNENNPESTALFLNADTLLARQAEACLASYLRSKGGESGLAASQPPKSAAAAASGR
jgi:hypothetical protein